MTPLRGCDAPLADVYDGTLLDLDGTVHRSGTIIAGVVDSLAAAAGRGVRHIFVTNNASRTPAELVDDLRDLGITASVADVFTSAQAAAQLAAARLSPGATVLVVGGNGVRQPVEEAGLRVVDRADEDPLAVVQGWFPDLGWRLLAEGAFALEAGALWVATNLDLTLPTSRGLAPGNGSFVQVLANACGRRPDLVAGKPEPAILQEAASLAGLARPLVVGDRLDTDIEGANAANFDSLLVLTGVTDAQALVRAAPHERPTFIGADLSSLLVAAPAPEQVTDDSFACGSARVRRQPDGELALAAGGKGGDDDLDLLRAACCAAWSSDRSGDWSTADSASGSGVRLSADLAAALDRLQRR